MRTVDQAQRAIGLTMRVAGLSMEGGVIVVQGVQLGADLAKGDGLEAAGHAGELVLRVVTLRSGLKRLVTEVRLNPALGGIPKVAPNTIPRPRSAPIPNAEGLARTGQVRQQFVVGRDRSVAYAEVDTTGLRGEIVSYSGEVGRSGKGHLVTDWERANPNSIVADVTQRTGPGRQDAKVKILDSIRSMVSPFDQGRIRLFVDQPEAGGVCGNCSEAILRFRRDYPGIEVIISTP